MLGLPLGQQDTRQHQVPTLARVVRLIIRAEAALGGPPGGLGQIALGQQQPGMLRRDRVEQPGRARRGLPGLDDRLPGPGRIAAGLPDPRQRRQAGGQGPQVGELAAQRNALADMPERRVELVPLVGHLAQAHIRGACGRQRRPGGRGNGIQRLLAGPGRRVQTPLGTLDLDEEIAAPGGHRVLAGRLPPSNAGHERALGVREAAAEPFSDVQVQLGDGTQHPLALAKLSQSL